MSDIALFAILVVLAAGVAIIIYLQSKGRSGGDGDKLAAMMERLATLSEQNRELRTAIDQKLSETHKASQDQFGQMQNVTAATQKAMSNIHTESQRILTDVTERLTKLDETNKQVVSFSAQLQSLQDILKNPKQRGILGEYYLETLLKNVLPPGGYQMQYAFADKEIVDAVVFVKDKIIPIDSKFSLENYNRLVEEQNEAERGKLEKIFVNDLKNRIQETAKYIRPNEGTMDFAFMFIPHEAIYYDLLINKVGALQDEDTSNLIQRAASKYHVIIISPTSFLAYLQTVLQGLRALQIEESAKAIRQNIEVLGKHIVTYEDYLKKLGVSLGTSVNHYNNAFKEFKKIDKDVVKITGGEVSVEPIALDRPAVE